MAAESEEFERAWAQIVADLTADDGPGFGRTGADAEPDPGEDPPSPDAVQAPDVRPGSPDQEPEATSEPLVPPTTEPASTSAARTDPGAFVDGWGDEGHFTPPPPPELPAGTPATRLGWAGMLGGMVTIVLVTITGWSVPRAVLYAAGAATLAGFVTLVWQLPSARDDGWDDGAQV